MNGGVSWVGIFFAHDPPYAGNYSATAGLRVEFDFDFDTLSNLVCLGYLEQHAGDAEVDDVSLMPIGFGNGSDARRPFDAVTTSTPGLRTTHVIA